MYLKSIDGPRAVTLTDCKVMTRADLPDPATRRWVASRKAAVLRAVAHGLLTRETALETYGRSDEEFGGWQTEVERYGEISLKKALQCHLQS